ASLFRRIPIMRAEGSWVRGACELALAHDARARGDRGAFARYRRGAQRAFSQLRRAGIPVAAYVTPLFAAGLAHIDGDDARAATLLRAFIASESPARSPLVLDTARRRLGELTGGDAGAELIARADRDMAARGVRAPARLVGAFVPGASPR